MLLLRDCNLINELTEGTSLREADVLIKEDRIVKIASCIEPDCECREMDLKGKTLLPGLIDAHVHLHYGRLYYGYEYATACGRVFDCLKYAKFLLDIGITTVRDMGDEENFPTFALRDAIKAGIVAGPNIQAAGLTIAPYDTGFWGGKDITEFVNSPLEMRKAARRQIMMGADMIKIYGTGSLATTGSNIGQSILAEDEICAAVEVAERKGTYVGVHCHGAEAIPTMIRCGVRTIEHASLIDEEACKMLDGRTDTGIIPTVGVLAEGGLGTQTEDTQIKAAAIRDKVFQSISNAYHNHDILMGWGTDLGIDIYRSHPEIEWKTRKESLGFSNIDLLKQATINSAKLIRMEDEIGTVKEGKLADLIVVDGNPAEDITIMYNTPVHVIKSGRIVR